MTPTPPSRLGQPSAQVGTTSEEEGQVPQRSSTKMPGQTSLGGLAGGVTAQPSSHKMHHYVLPDPAILPLWLKSPHDQDSYYPTLYQIISHHNNSSQTTTHNKDCPNVYKTICDDLTQDISLI
jgi:hypothetical protein